MQPPSLFIAQLLVQRCSCTTTSWAGSRLLHHSSGLAIYVVTSVIRALQYFPWAAFSTLKSYAMCADSYPVYIAAVVFALSSVPLFISLLLKLLWTSFSNVPGRGFVPVPELSATMVMKCKFILHFRTGRTLTSDQSGDAGVAVLSHPCRSGSPLHHVVPDPRNHPDSPP
ncbi:hypothetical protein BD311DRAFT_269639 [Dichomitus squalens]|uniref:Uncharacterized protein n=1 Tax=Dichomitus squalens TaxID=114155 RepID=A0A4Q9MS53_9APHY|nr:hypothetical protein BD311DRAFT_269639 [Dichomitus squalens]